MLDPLSFRVKEATRSTWRVVRWLLILVLTSLAAFIVLYSVFSLFIGSREENRLRAENRMYARMYPKMKERVKLVGDVISGLQVKDDAIYRDIFNADAPSVDPINSLGFLFGSDTIPDTRIFGYSKRKLDRMMESAGSVEENFRKILLIAAERSASGEAFPPMTLPLGNISYPQVGAAMGSKMSPFLKAYVQHSGLDLIVPQGDPVYAPQDGTVAQVTRSNKGNGNTIVLDHPGGYHTVYCHLSEMLVRKGQTVRRGTRIGSVGMSGQAFAPHLHYEVIRDSVNVNPVNYIFASFSPYEYANVLYMGTNTEQSMD